MNPLYLMLPGVIAASFAFMLPVATPPNAIVFANGYLKVTDMVGITTNISDHSKTSTGFNVEKSQVHTNVTPPKPGC